MSGFSLEPANIIAAPIMTFNANANGIRFEEEDDVEEPVKANDRFYILDK